MARLRYAAVSVLLAAFWPTAALIGVGVIFGAGFACGSGFEFARSWS